MKKVDSQALGVINEALGLTGSGAPITEFLDGQLDQVFDVNASVRRGRTFAGTTGLFQGLMRNIHTDAETLLSQVVPYDLAVGAVAPFPVPIPRTFDLWLLSVAVRQASGGGTLGAVLSIDYPDDALAFGVDDSAAAVVSSLASGLCHWDAIVAQGGNFGGNSLTLEQRYYPNMRLRRGVTLNFSSTSSLTATFDCLMLLGMFPVALGQDGAF